jgi:hypothetical protein
MTISLQFCLLLKDISGYQWALFYQPIITLSVLPIKKAGIITGFSLSYLLLAITG